MLAVSRALGNWHLKSQKRGVLIADPEVASIDLEPFRDAFIIIASDGVWDVCSNGEAVRIVGESLNRLERMGVEREELPMNSSVDCQSSTYERTSPKCRYLYEKNWTSSQVLRLAAKSLIEECLRRQSSDNLTVTIIRLCWNQDNLIRREMYLSNASIL